MISDALTKSYEYLVTIKPMLQF